VLGLYVHIPFCSAICNYCNFNRGLFDEALKQQYVRALQQAIARQGDGSPADTIYFGGGTPSLLEPSEIGAIIEECQRAFQVTRDAEITMEANPETVTPERLPASVPRVSIDSATACSPFATRSCSASAASTPHRALATPSPWPAPPASTISRST
jgi:coproporphyrinogen III oxidase-like Fe-S oxidoreductase